MKKRIAMLLCTAVLALGLAVVPALALAEPLTPVEVETYTYGPLDELRVNKVYQLSVTDAPSGIPTEDFEQGGRRYYLLDMTVANADHETVTYTAVFGSVELGQPGQQALYTETDTGLGLLLILICAGAAMIAVAALRDIKAKQTQDPPPEVTGAGKEENQYGVP